MFGEVRIINGKARKTVKRKDRYYIRVAIEFDEGEYAKAEKKIQMFGKNFTDLMRELLTGWNKSMGFVQQDYLIKDAGSLFDNRMSQHVQTAVRRALQEIIQCPIDANTN
ncbi:MAG: hypothetical protein DRP74_02585 [Candidatus Omnitrophota bacterium]|nr:MAG: hypothetical protein DRP74_02585 [Candidatus Omnitrophota bacterium]